MNSPFSGGMSSHYDYTFSQGIQCERKAMESFASQEYIVEKFMIGPTELVCEIMEGGYPAVHCKRDNQTLTSHTDVQSLVRDIPDIYEEKHLAMLAALLNFLIKGEEFQIITDPKEFREEYKKQVEQEKDSFEITLSSVISYGVFNVEEISTPRLNKETSSGKNELIFYVKKKIPYKVRCEIPIASSFPKCKYEMLEKFTDY